MTVLGSIAVAMFAGLMMSRVVKLVKLPAVTGYLIAGLLIGPFVLGRLGVPGLGFRTLDEVEHLKPFSEVALGFIAFAIGNEFRLSQLRVIGKKATVVAVFQALSATVLVDVSLLILHLIMPDKISVPVAITLGAIATATAPAATLMVVNQYKAKGPVVDLLLPIVALDDAVGLIVFAVSFGMAKTFSSGAALSVGSVLVNPLLEVIASLALGSLLGLAYTYVERFFHSRSKRLCVAITFVILAVSLSMMEFTIPGTEIEVGFSSLLVCMMLGTVFCNICPLSEDLMEKTDRWTSPLFALFFVISGAQLELGFFREGMVVLLGVVYIVSRSLGKYLGAFFSAKATGCPKKVYEHLGSALLPQAGVALGMCVSAQVLGADGELIRNIILFSVLIYELVGPLATKESLKAAGAITEKPREVLERRERKLAEAEPKEFLERRKERANKK